MFLKALETKDLNDLEALGPAGENFSAINAFDTPDYEALKIFDLGCEEARKKACFQDLVSLVANIRRMRANQEDMESLGEVGTMLSRVRSNFGNMIRCGQLTILEA